MPNFRGQIFTGQIFMLPYKPNNCMFTFDHGHGWNCIEGITVRRNHEATVFTIPHDSMECLDEPVSIL